MRGSAIKAWLAYAAAGFLATSLVAVLIIALSPAQNTRAIVTAAVIAYVLQLGAFAALFVCWYFSTPPASRPPSP